MEKGPLTVTVQLSFPATVKGADGKPAARSSLTFGRPKTRHVKQLAVLVGEDLARLFLSEGSEEIDRTRVASELVSALVSGPKLDGLTAILADMAGETVETIDDLDAFDLYGVGVALLDFFPSLKS